MSCNYFRAVFVYCIQCKIVQRPQRLLRFEKQESRIIREMRTRNSVDDGASKYETNHDENLESFVTPTTRPRCKHRYHHL